MVDLGTFLVPTLLETMTEVTVSPTAREKSIRWHRMAHEAVAAAASAGVRIALGTDAGLSPYRGTNLRELGLLVRFGGLTPMQAIVAVGIPDDVLLVLEAGVVAKDRGGFLTKGGD
jgi:imidazolonepropionase-like amidohydrolase